MNRLQCNIFIYTPKDILQELAKFEMKIVFEKCFLIKKMFFNKLLNIAFYYNLNLRL